MHSDHVDFFLSRASSRQLSLSSPLDPPLWLYEDRDPPSYSYTHALSAYSALLQWYIRSNQLDVVPYGTDTFPLQFIAALVVRLPRMWRTYSCPVLIFPKCVLRHLNTCGRILCISWGMPIYLWCSMGASRRWRWGCLWMVLFGLYIGLIIIWD
jgi:hypothetical protein